MTDPVRSLYSGRKVTPVRCR